MLKGMSILILIVAVAITVLFGCTNKTAVQQGSAAPDAAVQSAVPTNQENVELQPAPTLNPKNAAEATPSQSSQSSEEPIQAESNPPGDIPDSQVFIDYTSASGGYRLQVPEGWARTENGSGVRFVDKFDGILVEVTDSTLPLTAENIVKNQAADLQASERAVQLNSVNEETLKGGQAVVMSYDSNSEPDPVTNKQIRLENEKIYYLKDGKLAAVTLWAPKGADNVDQWNLISNSFAWGKK